MKNIQTDIEILDWETKNFTVNKSPFANLFGVDKIIEEVFKREFSRTIQNHIKQNIIQKDMREYLKLYLLEEVNIILPYFDSHHTIEMLHSLCKIQIEDNKILTFYQSPKESDENCSKYIATSAKHDYAIKYQIQNTTFHEILTNLFLILHDRFSLNNSIIPQYSPFRFSSDQFAQVVPDFYIQHHNVNLTALLFSVFSPFLDISMNNKKNAVLISGLEFNISFYFENHRIMSGIISLSGKFSPYIEIPQNELFGILKLKAIELSAFTRSVESNSYQTIMKKGLQNYIQFALETWIIKQFEDKILGEGIYLRAPDTIKENPVIEVGNFSVDCYLDTI